LHLAAGLKIVDWLNVGAGVQVLADLVGNGAEVKVDLFSKQVNTSQIDFALAYRVAPVVGLTVTPWRRLKLGATFRSEIKLVYQVPATVDLEGIGALNLLLSGVAHYSPHAVQFGASFDVVDTFTVALDGEWQNWSAAPSPYLNVKMALSGATLSALGLGSAFDVQSAQQAPGFSDTVTTRLGLEWRITERVLVRAGGFYRPTMVPRQDTAGTNILDGNAVGVTGGVGFNFKDPLEVFENPVKIDLSGHGTFILARSAAKEATDVVPSYKYAASVGGFSVGIRYDY
jgi:long-subunit fatty acid transport protein